MGVQLSKNFGQHAATICGISRSSGDWIVTIDDDLEQRPEDIPRLYAKAQEGYDLVYGVYTQRTHSKWRNITSEIARKLFRLAIPSLNHEYTSFRVINRRTAVNLPVFDSPFPFVDGYLSWITNNYATVEVEHVKQSKSSNYTLGKLIKHTMNIFITFSDLPLKLATWMGLTSFFAGVVWLSGILIQKLLHGIDVSGYASLMAGIVAFGGLQMFVLGIIGGYLGRINFKTSGQPLFLVSRELRHEVVAACDEGFTDRVLG